MNTWHHCYKYKTSLASIVCRGPWKENRCNKTRAKKIKNVNMLIFFFLYTSGTLYMWVGQSACFLSLSRSLAKNNPLLCLHSKQNKILLLLLISLSSSPCSVGVLLLLTDALRLEQTDSSSAVGVHVWRWMDGPAAASEQSLLHLYCSRPTLLLLCWSSSSSSLFLQGDEGSKGSWAL